MKLRFFILISLILFQATNLKALLIYQPGGYEDLIKSFMSDISQVERLLSTGNKPEAAKALSSAETTFKNIKENAQDDVKNYTLLRAYLSAYDFYPKDKIFEANKAEVVKFLKKSLENIEAKTKQLDRDIKSKESFKSTGDKAYDDYFKNCQERIKQFPKELLDLPVDIPQLIGSYECSPPISHDQWKKNNEELVKAVLSRDELKVQELLKSEVVDINFTINLKKFDPDTQTIYITYPIDTKIDIYKLKAPLLVLATLKVFVTTESTRMLKRGFSKQPDYNIAKLLLEHGADPNKVITTGLSYDLNARKPISAFEYIQRISSKEIINLLKDYLAKKSASSSSSSSSSTTK